ncbi:hypothetical protein ACWEQA_00695 [Nocardia sp. NPDC004085]
MANFYENHQDYKEVWRTGVQLGKLYVRDACLECRRAISVGIDIPAGELISDLANLSAVTVDRSAGERMARWSAKTALLFHASEPSFFTRDIALEIRRVMRVGKTLPGNFHIGIARIPPGGAMNSHFRGMIRNRVKGTIALFTCSNLGILVYVPHNSNLPIKNIIPASDAYWHLESFFESIWPPSREVTWPPKQAIDAQDLEAAYLRVRSGENAEDPIKEALRKAGLIDPRLGF